VWQCRVEQQFLRGARNWTQSYYGYKSLKCMGKLTFSYILQKIQKKKKKKKNAAKINIKNFSNFLGGIQNLNPTQDQK
jgi:hypothetical protein